MPETRAQHAFPRSTATTVPLQHNFLGLHAEQMRFSVPDGTGGPSIHSLVSLAGVARWLRSLPSLAGIARWRRGPACFQWVPRVSPAHGPCQSRSRPASSRRRCRANLWLTFWHTASHPPCHFTGRHAPGSFWLLLARDHFGLAYLTEGYILVTRQSARHVAPTPGQPAPTSTPGTHRRCAQLKCAPSSIGDAGANRRCAQF